MYDGSKIIFIIITCQPILDGDPRMSLSLQMLDNSGQPISPKEDAKPHEGILPPSNDSTEYRNSTVQDEKEGENKILGTNRYFGPPKIPIGKAKFPPPKRIGGYGPKLFRRCRKRRYGPRWLKRRLKRRCKRLRKKLKRLRKRYKRRRKRRRKPGKRVIPVTRVYSYRRTTTMTTTVTTTMTTTMMTTTRRRTTVVVSKRVYGPPPPPPQEWSTPLFSYNENNGGGFYDEDDDDYDVDDDVGVDDEEGEGQSVVELKANYTEYEGPNEMYEYEYDPNEIDMA